MMCRIPSVSKCQVLGKIMALTANSPSCTLLQGTPQSSKGIQIQFNRQALWGGAGDSQPCFQRFSVPELCSSAVADYMQCPLQ